MQKKRIFATPNSPMQRLGVAHDKRSKQRNDRNDAMGCVESTPVVVKEPPEAVPTYKSLIQTKVELLNGEPQLTSGDENYTSDKALMLIVRKIGTSNMGDAYQVETMEDSLFHKLQIHPAKPSILGIKNRLEDLVFLHYENDQAPIAFAIKNVPKGLNYYLILTPKPLRKGQQPVKFEGPSNCKGMYFYASVEFNIKAKVCDIKVSGQGKNDAPLYTMKQLNKKVWVIKKQQTVCAAIQQVRGMAKLTCFRVLYCAGTDPAFMSLLTQVIDSFLQTAKGQGWKFYDRKHNQDQEESIDWPPLDAKTEEKLFGREFKLF